MCRPGTWRAPLSLLASTDARMSLTSVDLPEPETPVTEVSTPSGNDTSISCRLCSRAPTTVSCRLRSIGRRMAGTSMLSLPERYAPVSEFAVLQQLVVGAAVHDPSAVLAGHRADVDDPVGVRDGVEVVLDDDQGVAQIPQPDQGFDQPPVVALMQADRRLVEHIEHADQPGADLRGQPNALRLTAGQRGRRPRQRQVVEPDVEQEAEPRLDLLEHLAGDRLFARPECQRVEELRRSRRSTARPPRRSTSRRTCPPPS